MNITSSKGLPIVLNYADIEIVEDLIQLIVRQAEGLNLEPIVQKLSSCSTEEILDSNISELLPLLPLLQKIVCQLESSKEFKNIVYRLLSNCTCNGIGITRQLFNDKPELREDYYMLEWEVVKFNILPFFKRLLGKFVRVENISTPQLNPI